MILSIIIVSYNTCDLTLACLESVYADTTGITFEVLVVDNNSEDLTADEIALRYPRVHLIRSMRNRGFAAANNVASKEARGTYLLLLNPDTVVSGGAIETLRLFASEYPGAGIWGGRTIFVDGSLNPSSCWRRISLWSTFCFASGLTTLFRRTNLFNPEAYGRWKRDSVREVDIVSGCFLLIRRELWDQLGGFDEDFFMYGEEADLCLRAHQLGAKPMITPAATIVHYGGASEQVIADKVIRLFGARRLLIERHWSPVLVPVGRMMLGASVFIWAMTARLFSTLGIMKDRVSLTAWPEVWKRRREWLMS